MIIKPCPVPRIGDTRSCPAGTDRIGVVVAVRVNDGKYRTEVKWVSNREGEALQGITIH